MIDEKFDAIVIGAGMAGNAAAYTMASRGPEGAPARTRRISGFEKRPGRHPLCRHAGKDHPGFPQRGAAGAPPDRAALLVHGRTRRIPACTTAPTISTRRAPTATPSSASQFDRWFARRGAGKGRDPAVRDHRHRTDPRRLWQGGRRAHRPFGRPDPRRRRRARRRRQRPARHARRNCAPARRPIMSRWRSRKCTSCPPK